MERRGAKRRIRRLPVTFSDGKDEYSGMSSNFSSTGLFIRTRKSLYPGTTIKIVLEMDKRHKTTINGVVIWSIKTGIADFKNGMGIKLTSISQEYEDFIQNLHD